MSVIFVTIEDLSNISGSGVATKEIVTALGKLLDEPLYVICSAPSAELSPDLREHVERFLFLKTATKPGNPIWHIKQELKTGAQILRLLLMTDVRSIITRQSPSTVFPAVLARIFGVHHTLLLRGWVNSHDDYGETKFTELVELVIQGNVRLSDNVLVAFEELQNWVQGYRVATQSPVEVLPNAVDPDTFVPEPMANAREKLEIHQEHFVVGFVGSLAKRHELKILFQAVSNIENAHLLLVGDGELRTELEGLSEELGIDDRTQFIGEVEHSEVPKYISVFDVGYGMISERKPSSPIKCYEYLACERPVLSRNSPQMQFISEVGAGCLTERVDVVSVESCLSSLKEITRRERIEMGKAGREYVIKNASWGHVAEQILSKIP